MVLTTKTLGGPWPENYWWCNWHQKILKLETKQTRIQSCTDWSLKRPWSSNKAAVTKLLPSVIVTGHQLPWPPCHIQCFQGFIHANQCLTEVPSKVHILKPFGSTLRLNFQLPRDYSYPSYPLYIWCIVWMCHESRDWRTLFEPAPPSLLDAQPWPSRSLEQLVSIRNQIWRMRRLFWHRAQNGLQYFHVNLWHRNCKSPTLISHRLLMINTSRHAWGWSLSSVKQSSSMFGSVFLQWISPTRSMRRILAETTWHSQKMIAMLDSSHS